MQEECSCCCCDFAVIDVYAMIRSEIALIRRTIASLDEKTRQTLFQDTLDELDLIELRMDLADCSLSRQ